MITLLGNVSISFLVWNTQNLPCKGWTFQTVAFCEQKLGNAKRARNLFKALPHLHLIKFFLLQSQHIYHIYHIYNVCRRPEKIYHDAIKPRGKSF